MKLVGASDNVVCEHLDLQWPFTGESYEIDHVFPFRLYNIGSLEGQQKVMHFSNLQPLTVQENRSKWNHLPTKAMAAKVARWAWPDGVTEDMLPDIYDGWATPLRMRAPAAAPSSPPDAN